MLTARISSKGWIVIPSELRKKYHFESGQEVQIVDYGGVLSLMPISNDAIGEGLGALEGGPSLVQALLAARRKERLRGKQTK